jgi:cathepsin C
MRCGHDQPSREETSHLANSPYAFEREYYLTIDKNEASVKINNQEYMGNWTMVYDEGFNIDVEEFNFFAFSKYSTDNTKSGKVHYVSQCYSTCVGWYHNKDKSQWGCWQASKEGYNSDHIVDYDTNNSLNIVQPKSTNDIIDSFLNMRFRSTNTVIESDEYKEDNNDTHSFIRSSFLAESEHLSMRLDSKFKAHEMYINKLNEVEKSWNAEVHPNFSGLSIKELNKIAGIPRTRNDSKFKVKQPEGNTVEEDVSMFPKKFDWMDKLKPAGSQGNCGSCYTYSTIRMLEARLKILYDHDVSLSVQHALDCSFYNQGCGGGYPYLTMKFANEFGLIPEYCKPYTV